MLLVLTPILWAAEVPSLVGYPILRVQFALLVLGFGLPLAFLHVDSRGQRGGDPTLVDGLLALFGLVTCFYGLSRMQGLVQTLFVERVEAVVLSASLLLLTLECVRRVLGHAMLFLVLAFMLYALLGHHAPGVFQTLETPVDTVLIYSVIGGEALIGPALIIVGSVVLIYLVFGRFLIAGGGGALLTDLALTLSGRSPAAPAKIAVLSSGILGSISGSVSANVVATGSITIPAMKKIGIPGPMAAGVEATASTGGQLMPPVMGAAAFLMVEFIGVDYIDVIVAALIPSILLYAVLMFRTDHLFGGLSIPEHAVPAKPRAFSILQGSPVFLIPFIGIVVALLVWHRSPVWAGMLGLLLAVASGLIFHYGDQRLTFKGCWETLVQSGYVSIDIVVMGAAAGIMIGTLNMTGLGVSLGIAVSEITNTHPLFILFITGAAAVLLGTGLPTTAIYVVVATLLAPSLVDLGIKPLAAHLFVFYTGMLCMITPPIAFASYAAATVARTDFLQTAMAAIRFAWPIYMIPFLFALSPPLLMDGSAVDIVTSVVLATVGLWFVSASARVGKGKIRVVSRVSLLAVGLLICYPRPETFSSVFNAGGVIGALVFAWAHLARRRQTPKSLGQMPFGSWIDKLKNGG